MPQLWLPGYVQAGLMWDAEHCPDPLPGGFIACMAYFAGSSAAHVWDADEIDRVKAASLGILPVCVPTPGTDNPLTAAQELIDRLHAEGVPDNHACHVMWDMETGKEPDPRWLDKAADRVRAAGYLNLVYGSPSTLFNQPPRDGYVVANPTNQIHMYERAHVRATQYAFDVRAPGGLIDQSAIASDLVAELWHPGG